MMPPRYRINSWLHVKASGLRKHNDDLGMTEATQPEE